MADSRIDIVELKEGNFARWRNDVQVALIIAQCSEVVEQEQRPHGITEEQWTTLARNARAIILKALRDEYWRVAPGDSPFRILQTIEAAFQPTSSLIAIMKLCKFFALSQGDNGDIVREITSAYSELQHALRASPVLQNAVVIDQSVRTAILAFALEKSDPTAASQIKERFELNAITFEQAVSRLAEVRVTHKGAVTGNPVVNSLSDQGSCTNCKGKHPFEKCWFRDPSLAPERLRSRICTRCKKIGHATKSCPILFSASTVSERTAKYESQTEHVVLGVRHVVYSTCAGSPSPIIVDSGATIHMMHDREMFSTYENGPPSVANSVFTASGQPLPVMGRGNVCLETFNVRSGVKQTLEITDVLHVPDLKENIISVAVLDKKGVEITTGNGKMIVRKDGKFLASATLSPETSQYHLSYSRI